MLRIVKRASRHPLVHICKRYAHFFSLESADIYRRGRQGGPIFKEFSWKIDASETWAVVGPVASGKSSLADLLVGSLSIDPPSAASWKIHRPSLQPSSSPSSSSASSSPSPSSSPSSSLSSPPASSIYPHDAIDVVSFKEDSHLFKSSNFSYHQRYNWVEEWEDVTLEEYLKKDFEQTPTFLAEFSEVTRLLHVADLLKLSFIKLSNGQSRRARIARALLRSPYMLILDEPFMGLDISSREEVAKILGRIVERKVTEISRPSPQLLLLLRPQDVIPPWVTNILELEKGMKKKWEGPRNAWVQPTKDEATSYHSFLSSSSSLPSSSPPVVELRNVKVAYDKPILENINWTVREGEKWVLVGPNGSGKTTILSLIVADHPQAYANDIAIFGHDRSSGGVSIWDIKADIGMTSPEMHVFFKEPTLTARQVVRSAYFMSFFNFSESLSDEKEQQVSELFSALGMESSANILFKHLSNGQQRFILFMRAIVKRPRLLILDEPFQGMDEVMVKIANNWLESNLSPKQTLIIVTHHKEEIPQFVNRMIRLEEGKVVELI